jgi:hypothetical protein
MAKHAAKGTYTRARTKKAASGDAVRAYRLLHSLRSQGTPREFYPDSLIRLADGARLILETKEFPDLARDDKVQGAQRWVSAVNADGRHGSWRFALVTRASDIASILT